MRAREREREIDIDIEIESTDRERERDFRTQVIFKKPRQHNSTHVKVIPLFLPSTLSDSLLSLPCASVSRPVDPQPLFL